jgi:hypothetical protein
MTTTTAAIAAPTTSNPAAMWERTWRMGGLLFVVLGIVTLVVGGLAPGIGASAEALVGFYDGNSTRVLLGAAFAGANLLNLLWFVAAIRTTLAERGQDGWGTAATIASAMVGGLGFAIIGLSAALTFSITGSGNVAVASGLNDLSWALVVVSSFPRAMLIMAPTFGLFRAGLISRKLFAVGVGLVILGVLGGTTWLPDGFWAPDGAFSRFILPGLSLAWVVVLSRVMARVPSSPTGF